MGLLTRQRDSQSKRTRERGRIRGTLCPGLRRHAAWLSAPSPMEADTDVPAQGVGRECQSHGGGGRWAPKRNYGGEGEGRDCAGEGVPAWRGGAGRGGGGPPGALQTGARGPAPQSARAGSPRRRAYRPRRPLSGPVTLRTSSPLSFRSGSAPCSLTEGVASLQGTPSNRGGRAFAGSEPVFGTHRLLTGERDHLSGEKKEPLPGPAARGHPPAARSPCGPGPLAHECVVQGPLSHSLKL